ncbi:hypothetical protein GCK72_004676 [Caenorhabditis remanei]|nr:hypothetical protein GCK72_004676 [Caenorhabditis remanei]KAF1764726.1 hypothetical protein GCK72_004676 [Caenorhabditis remanei]
MISQRIGRLLTQIASSRSTVIYSRQTHRMLTEQDIKVTTKAASRLKEVLDDGERLRLEVDGGGCSGFEYKIRLDKKLNNDDLLWKTESGAEIIVDEMSLGYIKG